MSFAGLRVLSLESRRAIEMSELIRRQGGDPFVAPSMREVPIEHNTEAFEFAERLFAGEFDMMIFLTGVGARALRRTLDTQYPSDEFLEALREITVVVRGPKPAAVMREWSVPVTIAVPEPNTWRELLDATAGRRERRIAVQEYGKTNQALIDGLRARGGEITPVRVYHWDLPEDTAPLTEAVRRLVDGQIDVAIFTTSIQIVHLLRVAAGMGVESETRAALASRMIASIGPTTSEALEECGIHADLEPTHPKMGFLIKEAAEQAPEVLARKSANAR